ncbi:Putative uncharacterized protein [Taphrina deformans PYCC 5710]|uniref:CASTOR ACT domain-containing protein n=1 Tax=Taphrina deformans (strain PYCC 5710 / ATCC 11124 / CBS 356.35 / IMI 108563 / JCM 9778 / NBRC 8474) TaxID=1097556 RepID=R4X9A1_TAPDE|nr:Putative uncharacterized protein [Taphrina deformans PYCC 5710]|eukprot:CCG82000.1 Putative uncharacterized protein [Taphrina deformans PYCC 5710]
MTSVVFLEPALSLINIPLRLFPHFTNSILRLIQDSPDFFNISLTPTSLSVICPQDVAHVLFRPIIDDLRPGSGATMEREEYVCMQIDGEGMGDGSRLLELTQPLAQAGVSILFITTYFSDYVLVAGRQIRKVRKVLAERGFDFEHLSQSFITSAKPVSHGRHAPTHELSRSPSPLELTFDEDYEDVQETDMEQSSESLSDRIAQEQGVNTLQFLRQGKIPVRIAKDTKLVMLGSRVQFIDYVMPLTRIFLKKELPEFFSITKAPNTSPSLLVTQDLASEFDLDTLQGFDSAEVLIPIMLDLSDLESVGGLGGCGIVCGVVDELMQRALRPTPSSMEQMLIKEELVMSYLSTVVTGNVLVRQQDVARIAGNEGDCSVM